MPATPELTADFCNREYNNRALVPDFQAIFDGWKAESQAVRRRCAGLLDLAYGDTPAERLDLFPTRHDGAPLFVFLHGGYWRSLDKSDFSFIAPEFVAQGVSVAVVNYALCPQVRIDDIVLQVLRALAWLYRQAERYGFARDRIHVGGHSAGGHLSAMALCARFPDFAPDLPADLVRGAVSISGLYDLEPIRLAPFLNVDLKLDAAQARRLSPAWMPPATRAPLLTAVGGDESSEFKRQNALIAARWPVNFREDIPMPGFNHMTVCGELARPDSPLFRATVAQCTGSAR
jgi:arylformamidase